MPADVYRAASIFMSTIAIDKISRLQRCGVDARLHHVLSMFPESEGVANMREAVAAFLALTAVMAWLTARYLKLPSTIGVMAATLILSAAPSRRVAPSAPLNSPVHCRRSNPRANVPADSGGRSRRARQCICTV